MYFECFAQSLYAGFYVGAYGLVANFSAPSQRAQRFARMDALSLLAFTFSVAVGANAQLTQPMTESNKSVLLPCQVSAPTFQAIGYYGIYGINSTTSALSVLYLLLICKENPDGKPFEPKISDNDEGGFFKTYVWNGLVQPVIDLFQTMSKGAFTFDVCTNLILST